MLRGEGRLSSCDSGSTVTPFAISRYRRRADYFVLLSVQLEGEWELTYFDATFMTEFLNRRERVAKVRLGVQLMRPQLINRKNPVQILSLFRLSLV